MVGVSAGESAYTLVTGGVGFIGTNVVQQLTNQGESVVVLDNFSRVGVGRNAAWLASVARSPLRIVRGDTRDAALVSELVRGARHVFHFAAQVAVTSSLVEPMADFEVNARGTLNVLEAIRRQPRPPSLVFTSTNKVYGSLPTLGIERLPTRYAPSNPVIAQSGVSEDFCLDFHSPYGCSKGAADQYVLDYARSYGIPALVFRMSCIYGPHQCGNEDQGWVAHFVKQALAGHAVTIYGDGLQVRDVLFVGDLVTALLQARARAAELAGRAFNIGGGPENTLSLLELIDRIRTLTGRELDVRFERTRVGDQRYYVSDVTRFTRATGWVPRTAVASGLVELLRFFELEASSRAVLEDEVLPVRRASRAPSTNDGEFWTAKSSETGS